MTARKPNRPTEMPITLISKLGSIVVHAQEAVSPKGHVFDRTALEQLINDWEVVAWMESIDPVLLPVKR